MFTKDGTLNYEIFNQVLNRKAVAYNRLSLISCYVIITCHIWRAFKNVNRRRTPREIGCYRKKEGSGVELESEFLKLVVTIIQLKRCRHAVPFQILSQDLTFDSPTKPVLFLCSCCKFYLLSDMTLIYNSSIP